MTRAKIEKDVLIEAAKDGPEVFFEVVEGAIEVVVKRTLNNDEWAQLEVGPTTLMAYKLLRDELLEGGWIQLIHNGYGPFVFINPLDKVLKRWGLTELASLIQKAHKLYSKYHKEIDRDMDYDAFMALYEHYPAFEKLDDEFVENEETFTTQMACYIDDHLEDFVDII